MTYDRITFCMCHKRSGKQHRKNLFIYQAHWELFIGWGFNKPVFDIIRTILSALLFTIHFFDRVYQSIRFRFVRIYVEIKEITDYCEVNISLKEQDSGIAYCI